jgi:acetyltransferase-like isoleucine patch superfamily enzyme
MTGWIKRKIGLILFSFLNPFILRYSFPLLSWVTERLRMISLRMMGAKIAKNSWVRSRLFVTNPKFLRIGINSKIGICSNLFLYDEFHVGDNVEIGSRLTIHTAEHKFNDPDRPIPKQGSIYMPVIIKSNVYIGSNVIILPGITVNEKVIVAAGAVITKDLESGFIYGGVPAKKLKKIFNHVKPKGNIDSWET